MHSFLYVSVSESEADYACAVLFNGPTLAEHYNSFGDDDCSTTMSHSMIRHVQSTATQRNKAQPFASC